MENWIKYLWDETSYVEGSFIVVFCCGTLRHEKLLFIGVDKGSKARDEAKDDERRKSFFCFSTICETFFEGHKRVSKSIKTFVELWKTEILCKLLSSLNLISLIVQVMQPSHARLCAASFEIVTQFFGRRKFLFFLFIRQNLLDKMQYSKEKRVQDFLSFDLWDLIVRWMQFFVSINLTPILRSFSHAFRIFFIATF